MRITVLSILFCAFFAANISAQTTAFTYQGSLKDGASPANGNYDFEFALFDAVSGGSQQGSTVTRNTVPVSNGIFSVSLDFGSQFPGANRFLEIRVRLAGQPGITTLGPRQLMNSAPYSVKSLTAASADTVNAGNITGVLGASQGGTGIGPNPPFAGSFLRSDGTGWIQDGIHTSDIPAGSGNYIQNTTSQQGSTNFNISGDGTVGGTMRANVLRTGSTFNINAVPVLSIGGTGNTFTGAAAGNSNTGTFNAFFGNQAGSSNTTGGNNSFFGALSGNANTNGSDNTFFGRNTGAVNMTDANSFFGSFAGAANTNGYSNSYFGFQSGKANTGGFQNSFFGHQAGLYTQGNAAAVTGSQNSFFGHHSGFANVDGGNNTFLGQNSGPSNISGSFNTFVGFGTGFQNTQGNFNTLLGVRAAVASSTLTFATAIGADAEVSASNTVALGRSDGSDRVRIYGKLAINTRAAATATHLCINTLTDEIADCSSSIRYKKNVVSFDTGLSLVNRLRPVTFDWKESNENDLGLIAEEVEAINPLLVTYNKNGEVQGVKYDRIGVVLVNAVKEQQTQIEAQQKQIETLTQALCSLKSELDVCKQK
jgi:Chaperone of endosialidase